ncbi:MAG TPA: hypothetical protein VFE62_27620 [Gemmataceae bacterium]|nr:hypothetical protein [Gemmataceae bacterium]
MVRYWAELFGEVLVELLLQVLHRLLTRLRSYVRAEVVHALLVGGIGILIHIAEVSVLALVEIEIALDLVVVEPRRLLDAADHELAGGGTARLKLAGSRLADLQLAGGGAAGLKLSGRRARTRLRGLARRLCCPGLCGTWFRARLCLDERRGRAEHEGGHGEFFGDAEDRVHGLSPDQGWKATKEMSGNSHARPAPTRTCQADPTDGIRFAEN